MENLKKEMIDREQNVWKKSISAIQIWILANIVVIILASLVLIQAIKKIMEILNRPLEMQGLCGLLVVPVIIVVLIISFIIAGWGHSRDRINVILRLFGGAFTLIICGYLFTVHASGSHLSSIEEYLMNYFMAIGIAQGFFWLMVFLEYRRVQSARNELNKMQEL